MDRPATAKLFRNGRSQAVRLPARFRFEGADEVFVSRVGDKVILSAKPSSTGPAPPPSTTPTSARSSNRPERRSATWIS